MKQVSRGGRGLLEHLLGDVLRLHLADDPGHAGADDPDNCRGQRPGRERIWHDSGAGTRIWDSPPSALNIYGGIMTTLTIGNNLNEFPTRLGGRLTRS